MKVVFILIWDVLKACGIGVVGVLVAAACWGYLKYGNARPGLDLRWYMTGAIAVGFIGQSIKSKDWRFVLLSLTAVGIWITPPSW